MIVSMHIAFEFWSAIFCGIAIICVLVTRFQDKKKSKLMIYQLLFMSLLNIFEMLAYAFRGNDTQIGIYLVRISNFIVFLINHVLLILGTHYICYRMGNKSGKGTKITKISVTTLCVIGIILLVLSRIFGFYYGFDAQNRYYRLSDSFWIMAAIQMTAIIILVNFTFFHWKQFKPLEKIAYLSYEILPVVASGIQIFTYGVSLSTIAATYSVLLMFVLYEIEYSEKIVSEKQRIQSELLLAKSIQTALLPHAFPLFPDRKEFDIYAMMDPAREVGGDFYDCYLIDDDHLCMVIADVSGKGIPAALFMTISKTILKSCAMLGHSAADILSKTNAGLTADNQTDMFVTVWLGIFEISTGKLSCANAGHEYPAIKRKDGAFELYKDKHSFVLGGMADIPYKEYTMQLNHGDMLFLYTDGVPEATDAKNKMYGTARMIEALNSDPKASPKQLLENTRADINKFVKEAEQFDDLTMVCLKYM